LSISPLESASILSFTGVKPCQYLLSRVLQSYRLQGLSLVFEGIQLGHKAGFSAIGVIVVDNTFLVNISSRECFNPIVYRG
jgi:hypothetical protein